MNSRHLTVLVLVALGSAGIGWMLRGGVEGVGSSAWLPWSEPADRGNWKVQSVSSGEDAARKRPGRTAKATPDKPAMRMNMDGSITVPAGFTDRILVNVMDHDGRIFRDELALFGINGEKADQLLKLADEVKAAERDRQAKHAKILKDEDGVTVLMIPPGNAGGKNGEDSRREAQAGLDGILGQEHPLVAKSLGSRFSSISSSWQEQTLIVDTRRTKSGKREYHVYSYRDAYGHPPPENAVDAESLMKSAFGVRTYYSEEVPDDLRHLFK